MANDSRGANKKPVNKPIIPKPPNIPKNGQNIYARQRLLNSPNNLNNSVISDDSDHLSEILNTSTHISIMILFFKIIYLY